MKLRKEQLEELLNAMNFVGCQYIWLSTNQPILFFDGDKWLDIKGNTFPDPSKAA